jgi:GNAT superfamily N-acetyltransferase
MGTIRPCSAEERGDMLAIINAAAEAYRGVIPADCWREPYMGIDELDQEIAAGARFVGYELERSLVGIMAHQAIGDVDLIRHAYVLPAAQRRGVGAALLEHLRRGNWRQSLVGTWADVSWAINFYERHGYRSVARARTAVLLNAYWTIPARQVETSVVLANPPLE